MAGTSSRFDLLASSSGSKKRTRRADLVGEGSDSDEKSSESVAESGDPNRGLGGLRADFSGDFGANGSSPSSFAISGSSHQTACTSLGICCNTDARSHASSTGLGDSGWSADRVEVSSSTQAEQTRCAAGGSDLRTALSASFADLCLAERNTGDGSIVGVGRHVQPAVSRSSCCNAEEYTLLCRLRFGGVEQTTDPCGVNSFERT